MLYVLLSELMFGNMGVEIPEYVRIDNPDALSQVDSVNTATNEKRPDGFLEINSEELEKTNWLSVGFIPGDINTSNGLTKSLSSANMGGLSAVNVFRIATDGRKTEIGKKTPSAKRYIV